MHRVQYATVQDLEALCLPAAALSGVSAQDQEAALLSASGEADDYVRTRYDVPLERWSESLRVHVAAIAAYRIMTRRGYQPQGPDLQLRMLYEDAVGYLKRVASGAVTLSVEQTSAAPTARARVRSRPRRDG